jgi:hypothetical protein
MSIAWQDRWLPASPSDVLTIYIPQDKTGSTSVRRTLKAQAGAGGYCIIDLHDSGGRSCSGSAVLVNGGHLGTCEDVEKQSVGRCQYFTTVREPIARLLSEFSYFCLKCSERKFCVAPLARSRSAPTCPNVTFTQWAAAYANQYTRQFSRDWRRQNRSTYGYYGSYLHGFRDLPPLTAEDVQRAFITLTSPYLLVLEAEELSATGWDRLDGFLRGPRNRSLKVAAVVANVNHDPSHLAPSAPQLAHATVSNAFDVQLYELLWSRLHPGASKPRPAYQSHRTSPCTGASCRVNKTVAQDEVEDRRPHVTASATTVPYRAV